MKFKLLPLLMLVACGAPSGEDHHFDQRIQNERFTKLLDQRRYDELISILEPQMDDAGMKSNYGLFLAQAHLGKSGFELFLISERILGPQSKSSQWDRIFPNCPDQKLQAQEDLPVRCIVKRIIQNTSYPDHPNFIKGKDLLLELYPDPYFAPPQVNFLMGLAEVSSVFSHFGSILLNYKSIKSTDSSEIQKKKVDSLFEEIVDLAVLSRSALQRARYSSHQVSKYLTGLDNAGIFNQYGMTLDFVENTGIPMLVELGEGNQTLEKTLLKVLIAQKIDSILSSFQN